MSMVNWKYRYIVDEHIQKTWNKNSKDCGKGCLGCVVKCSHPIKSDKTWSEDKV